MRQGSSNDWTPVGFGFADDFIGVLVFVRVVSGFIPELVAVVELFWAAPLSISSGFMANSARMVTRSGRTSTNPQATKNLLAGICDRRAGELRRRPVRPAAARGRKELPSSRTSTEAPPPPPSRSRRIRSGVTSRTSQLFVSLPYCVYAVASIFSAASSTSSMPPLR